MILKKSVVNTELSKKSIKSCGYKKERVCFVRGYYMFKVRYY